MGSINDFNKQATHISLTLLACLLGFVFLIEEKSHIEIWLSVGAIVLLTVAATSSAWYQHRFELRKSLFNQELRKFADTSFKSTLEAFRKLGRQDGLENVKEAYESFFKEHSDLVKEKSKEEIAFYLDLYLDQKSKNRKQEYDKKDDFTELVVESLMSRINQTHNRCFKEPLNENYAKIKSWFDMVSFRYKFYFFIAGIISFLITTILLLTQAL